MKLTDDDIKRADDEVTRILDRLHELTGAAVLLLVEREHEGGDHTIRFGRRGSPYSCCRMAQIYTTGEDNEDLSREISRAINPPDDGEAWKE